MPRFAEGEWDILFPRRDTQADPFGRLLERDANETVRRRRRGWRDRTIGRADDFRLKLGVGLDQPNAPEDVAKLQTLLHDAGFTDLDRAEGPTGLWSAPDDDALRRYQRQHGLKVDGLARPDGPTIQDLRTNLAAKPKEQELGQQADGDQKDQLRTAAVIQRDDLWDSPSGALQRLLEGGGSTDSGETHKQSDAREAANKAALDEIIGSFMAEVGRRGTPLTQKDINTGVRECTDYANTHYPDFADRIEHAGGGNENGNPNGKAMPEKYIPNPRPGGPRKGSSYSDFSFYRNDRPRDEIQSYAHGNTQDFTRKGRETLRESRNLQRMKENIGRDLAVGMAKRFDGESDDDFSKRARRACAELFSKWLGEPTVPDPEFDEGNDPNESP